MPSNPLSTPSDLPTYYAKRAAEYDRIYAKPERQKDLAALRTDLAEQLRGCRVLEVACGTGYWTEIIAASATSIRAVDINEEVLAIARQRLVGRANVEFSIGDCYDLLACVGEYNACLAVFWMSHVPKARVRDFLNQLHSLLEPGAKVVLIDNRFVAGSSTPISRIDEDGNSFQRRKLDDGTAHEVLKNFPEPAELRSWLTDSGSENVEVRLTDYFWMLTYRIVKVPGPIS